MTLFKTCLHCILLFVVVAVMTGCVSFSPTDKRNYAQLKHHGITVDNPIGLWEKPNSPAIAACLNILPGVGNFYLCCGNGSDSAQGAYGAINLIFWPLSILWGIPEAAIDANTLNKQYLIYYCLFNEEGKAELEKRGIELH